MSGKINNTVKIGKNVTIKDNVEIHCAIIGNNVKIGKNVTIFGSKENPVYIGSNTYISPNCYFNGAFGLNIGKNVTFSYGAIIFTDSGPNIGPLKKSYPTEKAKIVIKDGCWIGAYAILLPGAYMEKESILASHSTLKSKIKYHEIFGGNPAVFKKLIKL